MEALVFVLTSQLTEFQREAAAEQWQAICAERGWCFDASSQVGSKDERQTG
jgi:hypothetical protein